MIRWRSRPRWIAVSSPRRPIFVDVETRGELTTGMTVADRRKLTGKPPNLDVVVTADIPGFMNRLIERVGGLAADHPDVAR